jgi:hypothetical protein
MKRLRRLGAILALLATGCAGSATLYEGTYTRTWVSDDGSTLQATGPVRLELSDGGRYEVDGEAADMPPAREGRYHRAGESLILTDTSSPGAGYDLSLILEGEFQAAVDDATGRLVLTQTNLWGHSHLLLLDEVDGGE